MYVGSTCCDPRSRRRRTHLTPSANDMNVATASRCRLFNCYQHLTRKARVRENSEERRLRSEMPRDGRKPLPRTPPSTTRKASISSTGALKHNILPLLVPHHADLPASCDLAASRLHASRGLRKKLRQKKYVDRCHSDRELEQDELPGAWSVLASAFISLLNGVGAG